MSAPAETVAAPAPVEEVKPTETPAAEPAPVATEPKVEEAAVPAATEEAPKEEAKPEVSTLVASRVHRVTRFIYGRLAYHPSAGICCSRR